MKQNKHMGSDFDQFLKAEGILAEVEAVAAKRVITFQIEKEMKRKRMSKVEMATRMRTSRSSLDRLLDPNNISITLHSLEKAAAVLGKKVRIQLA